MKSICMSERAAQLLIVGLICLSGLAWLNEYDNDNNGGDDLIQIF